MIQQMNETARMQDADSGANAGWLTERDAVRVALQGSARQRIGVGARAFYELIKNPDDTAQVFLMGLTLNAPFFPRLYARITGSSEGARLMAEQPSIDSRSVDFTWLRSLGENTLGGAYARYLEDNHLDPDLFQAPPGLPPEPRFIAQRIRQTHDIWHVLTGYTPNVAGELALQGFTFGQLRMPSALLIATVGTFTRAPLEMARVLEGYQRGRDAAFLPVVRFEDHWEEDVSELCRKWTIRGRKSKAIS